MLKNNGFQGDSPGLTAYNEVGGTTLTVDTDNPLNTAITSSLKVSVPTGQTGAVGFSNSGYSGVPVAEDTYASYFWVKGAYSGNILIELVGASSGIVYGSSNVTVASVADTFTYYQTSFKSSASADGNNVWQLTFDAESVAGNALYFDMVQLFPVTFKQRYLF